MSLDPRPLIKPRPGWGGSALCAALALAAAGCLHPDVVRVYGGIDEPGRFISDQAYRAYARGAEMEARGELADALASYEIAASRDPASVEARTRVGDLRCRTGHGSAEAAFEEAEALDPRYEPLWRARAACAERHGDVRQALERALRAVELDPERDETVLLVARLLDEVGRRQEAQAWLRALSLRSPSSAAVWQAVATLAARAGDRAWEQHARQRLAALAARSIHVPPGARDRSWADVDQALIERDVERARRAARQARLDGRLLAPRALAVGRPELAKAEAELYLDADPSDSDSRVALALAEDLLGQSQRAGEVLAAVPDDAQPLTAVGKLLLAELLQRHLGPDPALAGLLPSRGGEPRAALRAQLDRQLRGAAR